MTPDLKALAQTEQDIGVASASPPQPGTTGGAKPLVASHPGSEVPFWYVDEIDDVDDGVRYGNVATCWGNRGSAEQTAYLFAAAPELLEVAKALVGFADSGAHFAYPLGSLQMLRAAIAKAEGRS